MTNRQHIERWFAELWGKRNAAIIDEMIDPDCRTYGLPTAMHGPAGFKPFYEVFASAFPRVDIRIEDFVEQGDKVAFRIAASLVGHDGKRYEMSGGGIARLKDGRFIEAWNHIDFLSLLTAVGAVKETTFVEAMRGQAKLRTS